MSVHMAHECQRPGPQRSIVELFWHFSPISSGLAETFPMLASSKPTFLLKIWASVTTMLRREVPTCDRESFWRCCRARKHPRPSVEEEWHVGAMLFSGGMEEAAAKDDIHHLVRS